MKASDMLDKIPSFLKNKYLLTGLAFFIWLAFFDRNNLVSQFRTFNVLKDLKTEKKFYIDQAITDSAALHDLNTDTASMERYAREKYMMKRDSEDIYIIVRAKKEPR
jgi:cell division protein DivIC